LFDGIRIESKALKIFALKLMVLIAMIVFAVPASAQVYKWVDSNGQTHFTQKPPPDADAQQEAEVVQANKYSHRLTTRDGTPYCGNLKLPERDDPLELLMDVKSQKSNWKRQLYSQRERLAERRKEELSRSGYRSSGNHYQKYNDQILAKIADLDCGLSWARTKEKELQPVYEQFQLEYKTAVEEFENYKNRCGPQPETNGFTTDPRAKEWARCQRAGGTREHNRRLREVKKLKRLASNLED